MRDQPGVVRKVSAEATRRMASRPAFRPSLPAGAGERTEQGLSEAGPHGVGLNTGHGLVGSALQLGAMLLMLPLGLALATGGAWPSVLWLGAALVAAGAWTIYEDASERRYIERVERVERAGVEWAGAERSGGPGQGRRQLTVSRPLTPDHRSLN